MENSLAAKQLLEKICDIDNVIKDAMEDKETESHVINELSVRFDRIVKDFPHMVSDIQNRIVEYHSNKGSEGKITDFIHLVEWYSMYLSDKPLDYFDVNGRYYGLRMSEVIDMFLIARFNC